MDQTAADLIPDVGSAAEVRAAASTGRTTDL